MEQVKTLRKRSDELMKKYGFRADAGTEQLKGSSISRCVAYGRWSELTALSGGGIDAVAGELAQEKETHVGTYTAARYLGLSATTLYQWTARGNGDVKPIKIMGRCAWPVAEIRRVVADRAAKGSK